MGKVSAIEWTDATWNPWRGCTKVSAGCANCYMFRDAKRFGKDPTEIVRSKTTFRDPQKWKEPRMIFVCSWSDFFHEDVPASWREQALDIMHLSPRHTFLLLTKRPQNILRMVPKEWFEICTNVWVGITAEDQETYEERLPYLLQVPAARRFISAEPLLGPLNLGLFGTIPASLGLGYKTVGSLLHWVIAGGESGPDFRLLPIGYPVDLLRQCQDARLPFLFKQWGGTRKIDGTWGGNKLLGRVYHEFPERFGA